MIIIVAIVLIIAIVGGVVCFNRMKAQKKLREEGGIEQVNEGGDELYMQKESDETLLN